MYIQTMWPAYNSLGNRYVCIRAGVKYVLSNTNTNTNTFFSEFQIQIQIHWQKSDQIQIQIQIQPIKYKYKYKYTLRPRKSCRHFTDDIFKYILLWENCFIYSNFTENCFQRSNLQWAWLPALVHIMAWCWVGNKPLSDQWWTRLLMHKCITRSKWLNVKCWLLFECGITPVFS